MLKGSWAWTMSRSASSASRIASNDTGAASRISGWKISGIERNRTVPGSSSGIAGAGANTLTSCPRPSSAFLNSWIDVTTPLVWGVYVSVKKPMRMPLGGPLVANRVAVSQYQSRPSRPKPAPLHHPLSWEVCGSAGAAFAAPARCSTPTCYE